MSCYVLLEKMAKKGFEQFMDFVRNDKNLLYDITETENGETEVEIDIFDENEGTEYIGGFAFDNNGKYIG